MESLLLRGRAPIQEDALTAALADLLDDLGERALVEGLLTRVRAVRRDGKLSPEPIATPPSFDSFCLELWPSWPVWGEPDLLITLTREGTVVAAIVIEVKYEAPKSGEDSTEDTKLNDQLGRYAAGLEEQERFLGATKLVVYLTASSVPPVEELEDSWVSIEERTKPRLDPAQTLRWLSWRDVDRMLRDHCVTSDSIAFRRVQRVRDLLERAGLRCFEGWPSDGPRSAFPTPPTDIPSWLKSAGARWRIERAPEIPCALPPTVSQKNKHVGWPIGSG